MVIIRNSRPDSPVSNIYVVKDNPPEGAITILQQDEDRLYVADEDIDDVIQALEKSKNDRE